MRILGLTGCIGMGKTTAARMFHGLGVPVHDADAVVHELLGPGGAAVAAIGALFPSVIRNGEVDRAALGALVFGDKAALRRLEKVVHPLVRAAERRFLRRAAARRAQVVVLDIPLLFETGGQGRCDAVVVVSAAKVIQTQRVMRRPGMTAVKLSAIRARQTPDAKKRCHADFVVPSGLGRRLTLRRLMEALRAIRSWPKRRSGIIA
ncbi:MAG: dephospho-CoA kinase [Alphaproteobacteria bacterium]